jgi:hypothetical protein
MWMGGESGRNFIYQTRPGVLTRLCFHKPFDQRAQRIPLGNMPAPSAEGIASVAKYLADLGYNRDMIEWATTADPKHRLCLTPELAKKFNIDFWYNTEDSAGQHYTLPGSRPRRGIEITPARI